MRKKISRVFAGILAAILMVSSGNSTVLAGMNQSYGKTMVITTEPQEITTEAPENDNGSGEETLPQDSQTSENNESVEPNGNQEGETEPESTESTENGPQQGALKIIDPKDETTSTVQGNPVKGSVEIQIFSGIEVSKEQQFDVTLTGESSGSVSKKVMLPVRQQGDETAPKASVRFPELNEEAYHLKISGQGYITYEQKVDVNKLGYRVQVYTGSIPQMDEGKNHPGLIVYGDVDNNQVLDDKDGEMIVNAIESGEPNESCDLNGDGIVDLLDLDYFTTMEGSKNQESSLEKLIPEEAAAPSMAIAEM